MIDAGDWMEKAVHQPACAIMARMGQCCGRSKNEKNSKRRYSRTFHEQTPSTQVI
jgi:hypothetical protein